MKCLAVFVGLALVAVTLGEVQEWSASDDSVDEDATMSVGLDDVNLEDIMQNVDMNSFVPDGAAMEPLEQSMAGGACVCKGHKCTCCFNRKYRVLWKKYNINVCASVSWATNKFYFKMTFSGAVVYHSFVTRDLTVCKRFPRTITAKACVNLYRVNVGRRSFCIHMYDLSWRRRVTQVKRCFRFIGENGIAERSDKLE